MKNFNPIWENEIYSYGNQLNRYPYDNVVTFIYRNFPRETDRKNIKILEIGCGAGNNLWFAAREGFAVFGIDGSKSAIEFCRTRFQKEGLEGEFVVGDFTELPFEDESFDLVIDRGSIVCCTLEAGLKTTLEVHRVLKKVGKFFFNPYSQSHSSFASGELSENGLVTNITVGLVGVGELCFYSYRDVLTALSDGWEMKSIKHKEFTEMINARQVTHAEWEVIAIKSVY